MENENSKSLLQKQNGQLDNILDELGNFGKYQQMIFILITLTSMFAGIFSTAFLFATLETPYRCEIHNCEDGIFEPSWLPNAIPMNENSFEGCSRYAPTNIKFHDITKSSTDNNSTSSLTSFTSNDNYSTHCASNHFDKQIIIPCNKLVYKNSHSIVSEFDLGCNEWKRTMVGTMNNIGQLVGMPLTGYVADRLGRRAALVGAILAVGVLGIIKSFSVNYLMFLALEFGDGLFGCGIYASGFIMSVEYVGPKYRVLASTLTCLCYTVGEVILGVIAWFFPYWKILLRVVYSITAIYFSYFWLLPESYRWLLSKERTEEAVKIFNKAAKVNGVTLSKKSMDLLSNYNHKTHKGVSESSEENMTSYYHVLKSHSIMFRVFCASIWFITSTFVFYGLSLNSVSVSGNLYVNYSLVSLIEIPAYILYYLTVDSLGRKLCLTSSFLGSGLACISFAFVPTDPAWIKLVLFLFGKFSITIAFAIVYVYSTELFPTPLRASLLGTCSMFGRIGSMVAPQTPLLGAYMESLPLLLFGGASIISGLTVLAFPETNKIKLPDTIEEAENIYHPKKSLLLNKKT